jgi:hypothetical protein
MYLEHEFKASFRRSRNLAEDLKKITSQYRKCGTISDVTSFWRVCIGVNCLWNVSIINPSFCTFWWKSMVLSNKIWHASSNCKNLCITTMAVSQWPLQYMVKVEVESSDIINIIWRMSADVKLYVVCIQVISPWYKNARDIVDE